MKYEFFFSFSSCDFTTMFKILLYQDKPAPRRRRKRPPSHGKNGEEDETPTSQSGTVTPRKKRKPKAESANAVNGQISDTPGQQVETEFLMFQIFQNVGHDQG